MSDYLYDSSDELNINTPYSLSEGLQAYILKFEGTSGSYYIRRPKTSILINQVTKRDQAISSYKTEI